MLTATRLKEIYYWDLLSGLCQIPVFWVYASVVGILVLVHCFTNLQNPGEVAEVIIYKARRIHNYFYFAALNHIWATPSLLGRASNPALEQIICSVTLLVSWIWDCRMAVVLSHLSSCSLGDIKQLPSGCKWLMETQFKQGFKKSCPQQATWIQSLQEHLCVKVIYQSTKVFWNQTH